MWVRRAVAALVVAAVAVLIPVGSETPASAAQVVDPVVPSPYLTSTTVRATAGGTMSAGKVMSGAAQAYVMSGSSLTVPGSLARPPVPLTAGAAVTRGAAGNPILGGFTAGWAIGTGGLAVYAAVTGQNPVGYLCGTPAELVGSLLYMGLMPDCSVSVEYPEPGDITSGGTASYGGMTVSYVAAITKYYSPSLGTVTTHCFRVTNPVAGITTQIVDEPKQRAPEGWSCVGVAGNRNLGPSYQAPAAVPPRVELWEGNVRRATSTPVVTKPKADAIRTPRCRIAWRDGTTTTGSGTPYTETGGMPISSSGLGCEEAFVSKPGAGPDLLPGSITVESEDESGAITEISKEDVPDFTESERVGLTPGDNTGLRLLKVVSGVTQSCMTWEVGCVGWWTKTAQGTNGSTDEGTYRCEYGGRAVDLAECGIYRNTFDTQTENPTITDPSTGEQVDWSSVTDPANQFGTGAQSGQSTDRCVVSFSLNPVDWVMRPLRCLFEPRQSKIDQVNARFQAAWLGSGVGALGVTLGGFVDAFNAAEGCGGLPFHLEAFGTVLVDTRLLAACEEPARGIAATVRAVLTVGILGAGLFASIRYLSSLFGFVGYGRTEVGGGGMRGSSQADVDAVQRGERYR